MKTKEEYIEAAKANFMSGYNCAQAVLVTFADELGIDKDTAAKMAQSFGAGMGGLREVCGACSGMFMCAGLKFGNSDTSAPDAIAKKKEHYALIQDMAKQFAEKSGGSIICRELLGLAPKKECVESDKNCAAKRDAGYFKKRPCVELVGDAAGIFADKLLGK